MSSNLLAIFCIAFVIANADAQRPVATWIESPRITNRGEWGPEDLCPPQTFVFGFRLKVQTEQGSLLDDTALNAVELSCIDHDSKQVYHKGEDGVYAPTYIRSSEGFFGNWGGYFECDITSFATGFELRSEAPTLIDNSAANNMALTCSDGRRMEGNGLSWGDWTGPLNCPRGTEVCGIKTQVEEAKPIPADNTGLNNVDLACCFTDQVYF